MTKKIFFLLLVGLLAGSAAAAATAQDSTAPISGAPGTMSSMDMAGLPITNMSMTTSPSAAANKQYVDQQAAALLSRISALESRVNSLSSGPSTSTTPTTPTTGFQPMEPGSSSEIGFRLAYDAEIMRGLPDGTFNQPAMIPRFAITTLSNPLCSGTFQVFESSTFYDYGGFPILDSLSRSLKNSLRLPVRLPG